MIRFYMPEAAMPQQEKKELLKKQFNDYLESDALLEMMSLLGTDPENLPRVYAKRKKASGGIMETQDMDAMPELEIYREKLYPLFQELGSFDINTPRRKDYTRILIYGGAIGTCFDRTRYGAKYQTERTLSVDALTCYRPINPVERIKCGTSSMADTEFGALTEAFQDVYGLESSGWEDSFRGDRNLNSISCCRRYIHDQGSCSYRLFAAPSSDPEIRRADTGDCLSFYMERTSPDEKESLLAVTSNRYCNRQFIQTAYQLISGGCPSDFDIIGCHPDDDIESVDEYDPLQYLQDLIGTLDWIRKFSLIE